jgi:hypothetical protein
MSHIRGADRSEVLLFPEALDDYITQDNPVRFIEAFVLSLDWPNSASPARPPLRPADQDITRPTC